MGGRIAFADDDFPIIPPSFIPPQMKMTPEYAEKMKEWIESLPKYYPMISGRPCIKCLPDGTLPEEVIWDEYAELPRNQDGCGVCWAFGAVGLIEVQYAINCCEYSDDPPYYLRSRYCCPDPFSYNCGCPVNPVDGSPTIHLSVQLALECSSSGIDANFCDGSGSDSMEDFFINVGTTYEVFEPYEGDRGGVNYGVPYYSTPFPGICPLLDRGSPSTGYSERNGISDIMELSNPDYLPEFFRVGRDPRGNYYYHIPVCSPDGSSCDYEPVKMALAQGIVMAADSPQDRHTMLLIGYKDNGNIFVYRNSHNDMDSHGNYIFIEIPPGQRGWGNFVFTAQVINKYYGPSQDWLEGDEDDDTIPNIHDHCLYIPNPGDSHVDSDEDFYPEDDPASGAKGCDMCPGGRIGKNSANDSDRDGIGDFCDACPNYPFKDSSMIYNPDNRSDSINPPCDSPHTDYDGDWRCDDVPGCDNCTQFNNPGGTYEENYNPGQENDDGDMFGNTCDGCVNIPDDNLSTSYCRATSDADWDGTCDFCDNCPSVLNHWPLASDQDLDGIGDLCDGCPHNPYPPGHPEMDTPDPYNDPDGDGLVSNCDLCPNSNPGGGSIGFYNAIDDLSNTAHREDMDGDGVGDRCDGCPHNRAISFGNDSDGDGLIDECDLCPRINPTGSGNPLVNSIDDRTLHGAQEPDTDGDTVADRCDNCPYTPNRDQFDSDAENWLVNVTSPGDACDESPAIRFWSVDSQEGACFQFGQIPVPVENWEGFYGPHADFYFAYTGILPGGSPNSTHFRYVKNAFCDCENYRNYSDCAQWRRCDNDNHNVADRRIATGQGWLYLLKKQRGELTRGDIQKRFARLYIGEEFNGVCPSNPVRGEDWGCFIDDDRRWYEDSGRQNIMDDEHVEWTSDYGLRNVEMQRFEWYWYSEPEINTNTNPSCQAGSCSANYRIYLHPLTDSNEVYEDAFFYPPSGVASIDSTCAPPEEDGNPQGDFEIPASPFQDIDCAVFACRDIFPEFFTIDIPYLNPRWKYTSIPQNSLVSGMMTVAVDPYRGKLAGRYENIFESPDDVIDTINSSSVLEPVSLPSFIVSPDSLNLMRGIWVFGGRNLSGYKNSLWHGVPVTVHYSPEENKYHWTKYEFPPNHIAPYPRGNSAIFFEPDNRMLVVFGGKTEGAAQGEEIALNDLWLFDISNMTWIQGTPSGDIPIDLKDFSFTQGVVKMGGIERPFGFIWGGVNSNGYYSNTMYLLDLQSMKFYSYQFDSNAPPGMTGASLNFDPASRKIHLFGGFDGYNWHNWLWSFNLRDLSWQLESNDCNEGNCPYFSTSSAISSYDANDRIMVLSGKDIAGIYSPRPEIYFLKTISGWENSSSREPWMIEGDCDGDGQRKDTWNSLCSNTTEWYHLPGRQICDTIQKTLFCSQEELPSVNIYPYRVPGLKAFRSSGNLVFAGKGSNLLSVDVRNPSSIQVLDRINLSGEIRDMEFYKEKLVIAEDSGLAIVDVSQPSRMVFEREIWTCGRAWGVEIVGDKAYFITPAGIGYVNLEEEFSDLPDRFGFLIPMPSERWDIVEIDTSICDNISYFSEFLPFPSWRIFEVSYKRGFIAIGRNLIEIKFSDEGMEIAGSLNFTSRIKALRLEGNYLYLNLENGNKPLVFLNVPQGMEIVGQHTVWDWAEGVESGDGKIYRMRRNFIDIAEIR